MQIVIDIPEKIYKHIIFQKLPCQQLPYGLSDMIKNGTPLPKGHGRLVDISKIDEDRIESDNPMIHLTINGEYTEAISLDYLNDLPTIIEADKGE